MTNDLLMGNFVLTHQPIALNEDGLLVDGQNRCSACVRADTPMPIVLCTGAPESAMLGADFGTARNVLDACRITGQRMSTSIASLVRRMMAPMKSGGGVGKQAMSHRDVMDLAVTWKDAIEFVAKALPVNVRGITASPVRALIGRAFFKGPKHHPRILEFCEILLSGIPNDPKEDMGALRLRAYLHSGLKGIRANSNTYLPPHIVYAKASQALTAFLERKPISGLTETKEDFFPLPE